jgi:hypothetical protein
MQAFVSINKNMDIEVKSGQIVMTSGSEKNEVTISMTPSSIDSDGFENAGFISVKSSRALVNEVKSILDPVFEYHGIDAQVSGTSVIISDIDYLAEDTIEAIEVAVKGMNSYLK